MELLVWFWCLGYDFFKTSMLGEGGCSCALISFVTLCYDLNENELSRRIHLTISWVCSLATPEQNLGSLSTPTVTCREVHIRPSTATNQANFRLII
ncbi:hypothetical protein VTI28DRAFT_8091 [Corynascus sepedonium]